MRTAEQRVRAERRSAQHLKCNAPCHLHGIEADRLASRSVYKRWHYHGASCSGAIGDLKTASAVPELLSRSRATKQGEQALTQL